MQKRLLNSTLAHSKQLTYWHCENLTLKLRQIDRQNDICIFFRAALRSWNSLYFRKTRNDPGSRRREISKTFHEKQRLLQGKSCTEDKTKTKRSLTRSNVPVSSQRYTNLNKNHSGSLNSLRNLGDEKGEKRKLKINNKLSNGRKIRSNENLNNISGKKGKIGRQKTLSQDSLFSSKSSNQHDTVWSLESSMERSSSNSDLEDEGDSSDLEDFPSR